MKENKIRKGLKLEMTKVMSNRDNHCYTGYISRVFKNKCWFKFESNNPMALQGRATFTIDGLQKRINDEFYCVIIEE